MEGVTLESKLIALQTQLDEFKGQMQASGVGPAAAGGGGGGTVFEREGLAIQGPKAPQITLLNSLSTLVWGALDSSLFLPSALVYACDHARGAFHVVFYVWTMNIGLFSAQYFGYHNAIERWSLVSTGSYEPIVWLLSAATLFIFCTVKAMAAYQELTDTLCERSGKKRERGQDQYSTDSLIVWLLLLVQKIVLENYPSIFKLLPRSTKTSTELLGVEFELSLLYFASAVGLFSIIAAFPATYPKDYALFRFSSALFYGLVGYASLSWSLATYDPKTYSMDVLRFASEAETGMFRLSYLSLPADFLACFLYGWYGFDNHWISSGKTLQERVRELESHWLYYVGFGLPWVVLSKFVPYFTFYACFLVAFPLLVVRGSQLQHQEGFLTKQYPQGFKVFFCPAPPLPTPHIIPSLISSNTFPPPIHSFPPFVRSWHTALLHH